MSRATEYSVVGRYMTGPEVTGYHLLSSNDHKERRYSKEQMYFLVGKGQVVNCSGRLYNDKVLLEGKGISLNDLPVLDEKTGQIRNSENFGKQRRGVTDEQSLAQLIVIGRVVQGGNNVGFVLRNHGGVERHVSREEVEQLTANMKIRNLRMQEYQGRKILRLTDGGRLTDLPVMKEIPSENKVVENNNKVRKQKSNTTNKTSKIGAFTKETLKVFEAPAKALGKYIEEREVLKKIERMLANQLRRDIEGIELKTLLNRSDGGDGFIAELYVLMKNTEKNELRAVCFSINNSIGAFAQSDFDSREIHCANEEELVGRFYTFTRYTYYLE